MFMNCMFMDFDHQLDGLAVAAIKLGMFGCYLKVYKHVL